jgi:hypothetical protein
LPEKAQTPKLLSKPSLGIGRKRLNAERKPLRTTKTWSAIKTILCQRDGGANLDIKTLSDRTHSCIANEGHIRPYKDFIISKTI